MGLFEEAEPPQIIIFGVRGVFPTTELDPLFKRHVDT